MLDRNLFELFRLYCENCHLHFIVSKFDGDVITCEISCLYSVDIGFLTSFCKSNELHFMVEPVLRDAFSLSTFLRVTIMN